MTNLEDKIIAYLDGTLDEQSRAELLHTLSVSPEKRKLLEEHIKLRELLALGHKPQSVPLITERKLADRIPVLMQELPYLADKSRYAAPLVGLNQTSYFTLLGRQVSNFFSSRFAPAVSLGTLALVGGLTWYMMSSGGLQDQAALVPTSKHAESSQLDVAPSNDQNASENASSQTGTTDHGAAATLSHRERDGIYTLNGRDYLVRDGKRYSIPQPENAEDLLLPDFTEQSAKEIVSNSDDKAASNDAGNVDKESNLDNSAQQADASDEKPDAIPAQDIRDPEELAPLPVLNKPTITGRVVAQFDVSAGATVRPNPKSQQYEAGSADVFPNLGIGYEFESGLVLGVEAGRSVLSQHQQEVEYAQPVVGQGPMDNRISVNRRVNYTASVVDVDAFWSQATVRYTVNPAAAFPIEFIVGAGAAFVDGVSPLISFGVGSSFDITESIALVGGVSMRGAWLDGLNAQPGSTELVSNGEAVGVTHTATTEQVFSSSLTARVGFRFGF